MSGNTVVPALLALEALGFEVEVMPGATSDACRASRGEERYTADDPVTVLGLVRLVELRGADWLASDAEIDVTLRRYSLDENS